jgi:hypothetical protein
MNKVTKPGSRARSLVIIPTPRFPKLGHGRKLHRHGDTVVIPSVHDVFRVGSVFFLRKLDVHVSNHVIAQIVHDVQFLNGTEFTKFRVRLQNKNLVGPVFIKARTAIPPVPAVICNRPDVYKVFDSAGRKGGPMVTVASNDDRLRF